MKLSRTDMPINRHSIIMGIDQSFTNTGITILRQNSSTEQEIIHADAISTSIDIPAEERMFSIINFLINTTKEFGVRSVAIESPAYQVASNNGRLLSGLFFSILTHFIKEGVEYLPVNPKTLKKFATGNGSADKHQMKEALKKDELEMLSFLSKIKPKSKKFEDIVDSFWLAKYGCLFGNGKCVGGLKNNEQH